MTPHPDDVALDPPLAICGVRFAYATYYADGQLLYLTKGGPLGPADGDTREGHTVFVGDDDRVVGLLVQCPRQDLDRDGAIHVTLREGGPTTRLERHVVEPLLVETLRYA
jgi:hypothetical protein